MVRISRPAAVLLFVAGSLVGIADPAHGATDVVEDEASCQAVFPAAVWTASSSFCTLPSGTSTIATGDAVEVRDPVALVAEPGSALAVEGDLSVLSGGRLLLRGGDLSVAGTLTNRGFWDARSDAVVTVASGGDVLTTNQLSLLESAVMTNGGTLTNSGRIRVGSLLVNDGTLTNPGEIVVAGTLVNHGTLDSTGGTFSVDCQTGTFTDTGTFLGSVDTDICFLGVGDWDDPAHWSTGTVPGNSDEVDIRGRATITGSVTRSTFTKVTGQLTVDADGSLSVSLLGEIETARFLGSFGPRLRFDGRVTNRGKISNNGGTVVNGVLVNYGEFTRTSVNTSLTIGGVVQNFSAGVIEGGLDVLAGGRLTNFGEVLLTKSNNSNAGFIDNGPVASFTLHNSFDNLRGAQLVNRGALHLAHELTNPPVLDNQPGAVLLNDDGATITVDGTSSLTNGGNVENRSAITNVGSVHNTGSWCGSGTVDPNGVTGTAPVTSCLPSIDLGADRSVDEGTPVTLVDTFFDPGAPTTFTASFDWDDGTTSSGTFSQVTLVTQRVTATHTYGDNGTYGVESAVCDGGDCATDAVGVTVRNVPPEVTVTAVAPTPEGSPTLIEFTATDPGFDDVLDVPQGGISCGSGGTLVSGSLSFDGTGGTFSCIFADGPSVETVEVTVADDDGGRTTTTRSVEVLNVPPTITAVDVPSDPAAVGALMTAQAPFTDPGADTFTADFDWGDGSTTPGVVTGTVAEGTHSYDSAGLYVVTATVTDDDGGSDTRAAEDHVVVYDPDSILALNAQFESPAGALVDDPDRTATLQVTGRVRYQKDSATPTGGLTVRERGDVLLDATSFDWLVVTSQTSYVKGSADWMGNAGATFVLSVEPGDTAGGKIRLQVWDASGTLVYDNEPATEMFADPTTPITRGAIAAV